MDKRIQTYKGVNGRSNRITENHNKEIRKGEKGEEEGLTSVIKVFYKTVHHFFSHLSSWLNSVNEPRGEKRRFYILLVICFG